MNDSSQTLDTALHARHVAMIAIGGIIGAGLFVGSSTSINQIGPAVVVSYALAGVVILMIMRMLSEMAMLNPGAGSFTEHVRIGFGETWGPLAGFVTGWLYWYFWVIVVAIEAIAGAAIIALWVPLPVWLIGSVLLALMTMVNLFSARSYGEFEFWLSSAKVAAIIGFIVIAGLWAFGVTSPDGPTFANWTAHGGFVPKGWGAVIGGVTSVIFALCGAEIATVAAAESRAPAQVIARMTGSVALRILLFYVVSLALIVAVQPWDTIEPGLSPYASSLGLMGIPAAEAIMNVVVLVAVLSCLNSGLYVTSRALFGLARHGDAPQSLIRLNKRKVPARATIIASLFGYGAMAASVLSPGTVFSFLVSASGALMLVIYLMVCLAQIRQRRIIEATAPETLALRMWLFPWLSYATVGAIVIVLLAMALVRELQPQFIASALTVVIVAAAWWALRRKPMR
ncbi:MAG: GABA permease [Novosphingobium sp. 28-62-57]|uniref:amino acid permease n=1 Tax=unclassified Novosphingobium TaxID=2644732 RepID=UPI000BD5CCE2|nr:MULTISPECIES: amino acid permease [unclassified Novosphingobium]OYW48982.1 MAG: GABA permease [Novosphingobium sp. 12-62-10]OYZ09552.1 MAG: GABA permease [Novosphingobium sp. 28-62-57]OZA30936.1 MAG: GABA permease [Novosphingobium sp. 17-62-9]HQS71176.1 amino acid permease [Novosphingobium sp.]